MFAPAARWASGSKRHPLGRERLTVREAVSPLVIDSGSQVSRQVSGEGWRWSCFNCHDSYDRCFRARRGATCIPVFFLGAVEFFGLHVRPGREMSNVTVCDSVTTERGVRPITANLLHL